MKLFDTHCHIHEATLELGGEDATRSLWVKAGKPNPDDLVANALKNDVVGMICVGTTADDSELAVRFVKNRPHCWASVGVHPHEAKSGVAELSQLARLLAPASHSSPSQTSPADRQSASEAGKASLRGGRMTTQGATKIVAIGECGLDYFYGHSPKEDQVNALRYQIELALQHDLPLIFHVRDAFDDFWPILDEYKGLRGVVHSFTDTKANLNKLLDRGLYVGINGIITFTKNDWQLDMAKAIPLECLVLETDAPFLTPEPIRGKVNAPENVGLVAKFLAELRGESPDALSSATTQNALKLFRLTDTKISK